MSDTPRTSKWRKALHDAGGDTNELAAFPAGGVRILIDEFEQLECELAAERRAREEEKKALCPNCNGTGRLANHVEGEVECGSCDGTGIKNPLYLPMVEAMDELADVKRELAATQQDHLQEQEWRIEAQKSLAAERKDAERYRWLQEQCWETIERVWWSVPDEIAVEDWITGLSAAIDAAKEGK